MSNPVTLISTTFNSHRVRGSITHGFRLYDNETKCYDNNSESLITDDMELLEYALGCGDLDAKSIFEFMKETEKGITINDTYYEWDEIKSFFP